MPKPITPEMIDAVEVLRRYAKYNLTTWPVCVAINVLDNADFFTPITDARDEREALHLAKEAKAEKLLDEVLGVPVDPAEWGDTTRADMARHQEEV